MIKKIKGFAGIALFIVMVAFSVTAMAKAVVPGRTGSRVNDYAGIIDKDTKDYLERRISSMPQRTRDPIEVIIATFDNTEGWGIKEFASQYGENWRRTKIGRDNGVILMIFPSADRVFIGVGQNLKDVLTEDRVNDIIYNIVAPMFKEGRYSETVKQASEEIIAMLEKADIPEYKKDFSILVMALAVIVALALVISINVRISKR